MSKIEKQKELSNLLYAISSKKELLRQKHQGLGKVEGKLLNYLSTVEKPICMNDLSVELKVSHSRITRVTDVLVKKKLVHRFPSKRDRRSWLAEITEKGRTANQEALGDFMNIQEDLISKLPQDKAEVILEHVSIYLDAYLEALEKQTQ